MNDQGKRIGLGLVGAGAFGEFCMETYSKLDGLHVAGIADVRPAAAEALGKKFDAAVYTDAKDLVADAGVDLVHIATPPSSHYDLVKAAAAAGKHVLCEKPLAMNITQADDMLDEMARTDRICPVNFVLRYNRVTDAVKAVLDSGLLGKPLTARLTNLASDSKLDEHHWFWDPLVSGGIFIEHGVHFFDLYRHWLGDGQIASAHTETRENTTQEDRVMCLIRFDSGAVAHHHHQFDQPWMLDRTDHRIVCELGDIRVDGWIPLEMTVDLVTDDAGVETLRDLVPDAETSVTDTYDGQQAESISRGKDRHLTKRVKLHFCPDADKQRVYSNSVRDLMIDQVNYLRDPSHGRVVTEENGRAAVRLAESAVNLAKQT